MLFGTKTEDDDTLVDLDLSVVPLLCQTFDLLRRLLGPSLDRASSLLRSLLHLVGEVAGFHLLQLLRSLLSKLDISTILKSAPLTL